LQFAHFQTAFLPVLGLAGNRGLLLSRRALLPQTKGPPSTIFAWPSQRRSPNPPGGITCLLLRQKTRVHKVKASASYKKCWIHAVVQTGSEDDAAGQSQVGHPCPQYSCFEKIRYRTQQYYTIKQKEQWIGYSLLKIRRLLSAIQVT